MVTAAAVAKKAKVSTATVSRVISGNPGVSEETKARVLMAIEELRYVPNITAQMLVKGHKGPVGFQSPGGLGVVVSSNAVKFSHAFFTPIIEGLELEVVRREHSIAFVKTYEEITHPQVLNTLGESVDGLVVIGCPSSFDTLGKLVGMGIPTVLVEFWYEGLDSIIFDRDSGMRQILDHLIAKGHRRIGYIGGPDRMNCFTKAMRESGLGIRSEWCDDYDGWTMEVGYRNGKRLVEAFLASGDKPTAYVAGSDDIAIGFIRACKDLGLKLPEDLSIAGFDDSPMASYMDPRLTTVSINKTELGRIAVRRLLERMAYPDTAPTTTLCPVKLIIRESVQSV